MRGTKERLSRLGWFPGRDGAARCLELVETGENRILPGGPPQAAQNRIQIQILPKLPPSAALIRPDQGAV